MAISQLGQRRFNGRMDVHDIRRRRVRTLIDTRFDGVDAQFAGAIDRSPTSVARWFIKSKNGRGIGERVARDIERRLRLPAGWLDTEAENHNHAVQQPLGVYHAAPELRARLLDLFDHLSEAQQDDLLFELEAKKASNQAIFQHLSGRLKHVSRERAAEKLPPAPAPPKVKQ